MAGWLTIALRSFAAAAGASAAALGTAQVLAILVWSTVPEPEVWRRQVIWLVFSYATAVLVGVAGGRRSVRRIRLAIANRRTEAAAAWHSGVVPHRTGARASSQRTLAKARHRAIDLVRRIAMEASRVFAAACAALGALTSFLLVWLPARNALPAPDIRTLALAAVIGSVLGAAAALLALVAAPIAANVAIWVGAMWIFCLTSVGLAIATGEPTTAPRLGVLDAPHLIGPGEWWLGPNLMILFAALFAFAVAATARWVGASRLAVAVSGLTGPGLVAATYLIVGPGDGLHSSFVAALVAPAAGLLTSVATALVRRRAATKAGAPTAAVTAPAGQPKAAGVTPTTPAPAQYSANPYPTNQFPTAPAWAAVPPSPPDAPAPTPPPSPAPATAAPAAPAAPAPASGAKPSSAKPASAKPSSAKPARAKTASAKPARAKTARAKAASTTAASTQAASEQATSEQATSAQATGAPAAGEGQPGQKPRGRGPEKKPDRKESGRGKRAQQPVRPAPARREPPAEEELPRTARPAEVVAVQATRPSPDAEPRPPVGRRAQRRAAKLAAARAEEEARLAKQIALEEKAMGKREREHVDWVKHLTSIPVDPTLLSRKK